MDLTSKDFDTGLPKQGSSRSASTDLALSLSLSPSSKHISAEHGDHVDLEITRESIEDFFGRFRSKLARDRMADLIPPCPSGTVAFCEKKTSANWSSFKRFLQTEETCDDFDKFRCSIMERLLISGPCGCQRK